MVSKLQIFKPTTDHLPSSLIDNGQRVAATIGQKAKKNERKRFINELQWRSDSNNKGTKVKAAATAVKWPIRPLGPYSRYVTSQFWLKELLGDSMICLRSGFRILFLFDRLRFIQRMYNDGAKLTPIGGLCLGKWESVITNSRSQISEIASLIMVKSTAGCLCLRCFDRRLASRAVVGFSNFELDLEPFRIVVVVPVVFVVVGGAKALRIAIRSNRIGSLMFDVDALI
ncbi:hypothetical protein DERF_014815 [Dermatophagoides farinae]|uniref:Uncharacterized protein n=1 Tax=Dermatophagoides farinae TaxID=6954 RepID=A0A922HN64_DERFA|nr:hypothetical protein DERF_014815 [Dermatophagoides farinae]